MTLLKSVRPNRTGGALHGVPPRPQVNLLPIEIIQARNLKALQRVLAVTVGGVVVCLAAVSVFSGLRVDAAQSAFETEQARTTTLLAEQAKYSPVTTVITRLTETQQAFGFAAMTEVLWADYISLVAGATPEGVLITDFSVQSATSIAGGAVTGDPLEDAGLGLITFTAFSPTEPDTSAWARALNRVPGLGSARISVSKVVDVETTSNGTAGTTDGPAVFETTVTVRVLDSAHTSRALDGTLN